MVECLNGTKLLYYGESICQKLTISLKPNKIYIVGNKMSNKETYWTISKMCAISWCDSNI